MNNIVIAMWSVFFIIDNELWYSPMEQSNFYVDWTEMVYDVDIKNWSPVDFDSIEMNNVFDCEKIKEFLLDKQK